MLQWVAPMISGSTGDHRGAGVGQRQGDLECNLGTRGSNRRRGMLTIFVRVLLDPADANGGTAGAPVPASSTEALPPSSNPYHPGTTDAELGW